MRTRSLLFLGAILGQMACGDSSTSAPAPAIAAEASAYLDTVVSLSSQNFYYRSTVNWADVRSRLFSRAGAAQTTGATYAAIDAMFADLGDPHSSLLRPTATLGTRDDPATPFYRPITTVAAPRIAYLWIPAFGGLNSAGRADTIQNVVARADSVQGLCGWVVDLRGNQGGIWPAMVAGLSPLLPSGPGPGWVEADTSQRYFYDAEPGIAAISAPPSGNLGRHTLEYLRLAKTYTVRDSTLPIAVLQSALTASAGEMLVLMLRAPQRVVRTFGTPSAGLTSQQYEYVLHDGATIVVTSGLMFDRQLRTYYQRTSGGSLAPDQTTSQPVLTPAYVPGVASDGGIDAAVAWLKTQPSCQGAPRARSPSGRWTTPAVTDAIPINDARGRPPTLRMGHRNP